MVSCKLNRPIRLWLPYVERLTGWGIVLLAAILRLSCLELIEFKADEAHHLLRGLEVLQLRLPLVGSQASVGVAKPPMMSLLMAVPLLFGRDPRIASAFIALLNVFAVTGCYLLAGRYYSRRVALVAAALFAANPWAVVLSRKVFTADVLAPFLVLHLYALHAALIDDKPWGWFLAAFALGIAMNITFSPLPLVLVFFMLVLIYRRRVHWRPLLVGVLVSLLLFIPYLYAESRRLEEVKGLLRSATRGGPTIGSMAQVARYALYLHSGYNLGALAGVSFPSFAPAHSGLRHLNGLAGALFILSLPMIVALVVRARFRKDDQRSAQYTLIALWLWVSLAVVGLQSVVLDMHYLVILCPAGFLAMALTVDWLWRMLAGWGKAMVWGRWASLVIGGGLVCLVAWQTYTVFYLYRFVAREDTSGGHGVPLRYWQEAARMVWREADSLGVREVRIITQGASVDYEEVPAILHYLLEPEVEAVFMGQGGNDCLLLPLEAPAVYLFTHPLTERLECTVAQLGGEEKGALLLPDGQTRLRVVVAPGHSREELLAATRRLSPPQRLDVGLTLLGYQWPSQARVGDTISLATYWAFEEVPAAERNVGHSLFNHLLDAQGKKIAQRDGFGLPERYWRQGLMLVQWFDLELPSEMPEGDYELITGLYRLSDLSRCQVLDEKGVAVGDHISLGSIHIAP